MQREIGTIFLPTRRLVDVAALARTCRPPWHAWPRGALARAERSADGRVHLVVVRRRPGGIAMAVTGVRAAEAEILAPIAARIRRGLANPIGRRLRGTSPFEDAVTSLLDETSASPRARRAVVALGARCPTAHRLHAMPDAHTVAARPSRALARALGSVELARRLQALARGVAIGAPSSPMRS